MVYNEIGVVRDPRGSNIIIYRIGKLRILSATGCKTDGAGTTIILQSKDVPADTFQFPVFAYVTGTYYTATGTVYGTVAGGLAGYVSLSRFNPSSTSLVDRNSYYYFAIPYVV